MDDFIVIDVETANTDLSSICQIGIAKYSNGELTDQWCSLINPEDYFDSANISIHGITEDDVKQSPKLPDVVSILENFASSNICISHTHFDQVSIARAFSKYHLQPLQTVWLDSAKIARRAWQQFAKRGYGLENLCNYIGYEFKHHNALEDAKATGQVVLAAIKQTGIGLNEWIKRVEQPITSQFNHLSAKRDGNPEGKLYGEILCFTGSLQIPRRKAADLAANAGCTVVSNVTQKTTLLVVGDQDISKLNGQKKSSKHRKAEELISKGHSIRIIKEIDFYTLIGQTQGHDK